jgi:hypothetical protein
MSMKGFTNIVFLIIGLFFGIQFKDEIVGAIRWFAASQSEFADKVEKGDLSAKKAQEKVSVSANTASDPAGEVGNAVAKADAAEPAAKNEPIITQK